MLPSRALAAAATAAVAVPTAAPRSTRAPTCCILLRIRHLRKLTAIDTPFPGTSRLDAAAVGIRYDKLPGEWYGPTTAACVLRDISELHAARLSGARLPKDDSSRCPPPPTPSPPMPPQVPSPAESPLSTANAGPGVAAASQGLGEGVPPAGVGGNGRKNSARADRMVAPAAEGGVGAQLEGRQRGAKRPCSAASPTENGQANSGSSDGGSKSGGCSGGGGGGGYGDSGGLGSDGGGGDGDGGGGGDGSHGSGGSGVAFPSSRPLRVFVSQGDVVYIDEVEAAATRGSDKAAAAAAAAAANGNSTTAANGNGDAGTGKTNTSTGALENAAGVEKGGGTSGGGRTRGRRPAAAAAGNSGKGPKEDGRSPAFFDPLLNPGSGGDWDRAEEAWSSAVLLLVPLRLGLDELSTGYIPSLLEMLRVPQSLGFLGGRPNHAIYFVGAQGDTLTGLDPHTTQAAPDMGGAFPSERYLHSLHCQSAVSMDVHRIDPSLALAFYLPNRASFRDLTKKIAETNPHPFSVEQTRPDYEGEMGLAFMINQRDDDGTTDDDDDDYVFVKGPER
eukprot:jgi/Undpi1/9137/HiC_scaffold_26.g11595.m1